MADACDVDSIWNALGGLGRYQRKQLAVLIASLFSMAFHVLSIVYIGFRPPYQCARIPETNSSDSNIERKYDKCSITTYVNNSGVVTTSETGCTNGYNYNMPEDRTFVTEWDLVCGEAELAELSLTLMILGQAIGAVLFSSLADRYGRKVVHVLCHIAVFVIALITSFMPNYTEFTVMRFLTGAFMEGTGLTWAALSLEMFPRELRGNMEIIGLLAWTTGISVVTPIAYLLRNVSWRYLQIALSILSSWALIEWWLIDESLRWLIVNGKISKANEIIKRACKVNKKDYEDVVTVSGFQQLHSQYLRYREATGADDKFVTVEKMTLVNEETPDMTNGHVPNDGKIAVEKYTVIDLLKTKRIFRTSLILWFTWITNSVTYYGIMLISSALAGNRFLNFFLGSIVEYPAALGQFLMINRYGRRCSVMVFHTICGVALILATVLTTTANGSGGMLIGATVFTLVGKMAITGSFSTIVLYTPELYPTNMRNVGIGMAASSCRIGSMVAPFSRNLAEIAIWAPGLIFAIMCAIVVFTMLWVPETFKYELPDTIEECEDWYRQNQFTLCRRKEKHKGPQDRVQDSH